MSGQRRPAGLRIGNVFGVPVFLSASWLLLAALVVYAYGGIVSDHLPELGTLAAYGIALVFVFLLLLSVLLHELGHALVCRRFGIGVRGITLELLGGYTEMESEAPSPKAEFLVAAAGPAISAVLGGGGLVWLLSTDPNTVGRELAFQVAVSNLLVAVFNMLPGLPLDGGRVLRAMVWGFSRDQHLGTIAAGWTGRVIAIAVAAVAAFGVATGWLTLFGALFTGFVVLVLWTGASSSIRAGGVMRRVPAIDLRALTRPLAAVPSGTPLSEALRQAAAVQAGGIVITDSSGTPIALVRWPAALAVPAERRPWLTAENVARDIAGVQRLSIGMDGAAVAAVVRANPAGEYLVTDGQDVMGVLRTEDLAAMLEPRRQRK
ncbi:M50 family metallopeptidase [Longispora albida]|uniref:M50 family metallopeptidase n=1 Tax=Longispora albida TaxID=203523 RepID=UPI000399DFA7|nr:M50 family metallopeptidase [Longispora albida]